MSTSTVKAHTVSSSNLHIPLIYTVNNRYGNQYLYCILVLQIPPELKHEFEGGSNEFVFMENPIDFTTKKFVFMEKPTVFLH